MLTKEQQEERKQGIGGSDAAAILGMSKFKTPLDVYLEKVEGFYSTDFNDAMHFGNVLEPIVAHEYEERTGNHVIKSLNLIKSVNNPFMIGNIDYLLFDKNGILECKTTSSYKKDEWGEVGTDFIPAEYLIQCAHYAIIKEVEFVDIAVLIGGQDFRIFTYHRNHELESNLIEVENNFWHNHVLAKVPPLPKSMNDINRLWPSSKEMQIIVSSYEIMVEVNRYNINKNKIKELENESENIKIKILDYIKDNEILMNVNGKKIASYKSQHRDSFNSVKFKSENPDLYLHYIKEANFRTFKTYGGKNEQ